MARDAPRDIAQPGVDRGEYSRGVISSNTRFEDITDVFRRQHQLDRVQIQPWRLHPRALCCG
jgi:hypothetical protein